MMAAMMTTAMAATRKRRAKEKSRVNQPPNRPRLRRSRKRPRHEPRRRPRHEPRQQASPKLQHNKLWTLPTQSDPDSFWAVVCCGQVRCGSPSSVPAELYCGAACGHIFESVNFIASRLPRSGDTACEKKKKSDFKGKLIDRIIGLHE